MFEVARDRRPHVGFFLICLCDTSLMSLLTNSFAAAARRLNLSRNWRIVVIQVRLAQREFHRGRALFQTPLAAPATSPSFSRRTHSNLIGQPSSTFNMARVTRLPTTTLLFAAALFFTSTFFTGRARAQKPPVVSYTVKPLPVDAIKYLIYNDLFTVTRFDTTLNETQGSFISPILIPRVSGSENITVVRKFIMDVLEKSNFTVQLDTFTRSTPLGDKEFVNIIATKDPKAPKKLVLAAHYDSKYFPNGDVFLGATDSAGPCAVLLDLANKISKFFDTKAAAFPGPAQPPKSDTTLQIIFFDGEESFGEWNEQDSLYGSRALAEKWAKEDGKLQSIELFILLDLLGAAHPKIRNYFPETSAVYHHLSDIELKLGDNLMLTPMKAPEKDEDVPAFNEEDELYFIDERKRSTSQNVKIDDDHTPFLERGVPIVHIIPTPFPDFWHTIRDNETAIVPEVLNDFAVILRVFVAEYLELHEGIASEMKNNPHLNSPVTTADEAAAEYIKKQEEDKKKKKEKVAEESEEEFDDEDEAGEEEGGEKKGEEHVKDEL